MPNAWQARNGRPTETVYGYTRWLLSFLNDLAPSHVVACFDESLGSCFRNDIYPDYKSSRVLPDDDLAFQLLACKKISQLLGVPCFASNRFEADDLIASFARFCSDSDIAYTVVSRDKDLLQVLRGENAFMWFYPDEDRQNTSDVEARLGFLTHQMPSFLALVGDVSDDIPGVPGVGKKTATALLNIYESWPEIKANLHAISGLPLRGSKSLEQKLVEFSDQIDLALQLTRLDVHALEVCWDETRRAATDMSTLKDLLDGLGLSTLCASVESD